MRKETIMRVCIFLAVVLSVFVFNACDENIDYGESTSNDSETVYVIDTEETEAPDTQMPSVTEAPETEAPETEPIDYGDLYIKEFTEVRTDVLERTNRPTEFDIGNSYDDLIFYTEETDGLSNEEKIAKLPEGDVIIDQNFLFNRAASLNRNYGHYGVVYVNDTSVPFSEALMVRVDTFPPTVYAFQISLKNSALSTAEDGDVLLISMYIRCADEGETGRLEIKIETPGTSKELTKQYFDCSEEWRLIYVPFVYKEGYDNINIRFGFKEQTVEIGGFKVENFGKSVDISDMPTTSSSLSELEDSDKGAQWRDEAWERIENVRKGDINIIVTDQNGAPVDDAKTEIVMYEHEFEWGASLTASAALNINSASPFARYFNSAVLMNELKWNLYEENPQRPKDMIAALNSVGIQTVRGHCLVWDKKLPTEGENTSVPVELPSLYSDKEAMNAFIQAHIEKAMKDMDGLLVDWDVLNEACGNTVMQDIHGRELIKEWYDMARATGVDVKLYYNETVRNEQFFNLLDMMQEMGVDYDGIGIQSHYSSVTDMEEIYNFYCRLSEYGKRLKITEYDMNTYNEEVQAEFTRDLMILAFSMEQMDGFYVWSFRGSAEKNIGFDGQGNPKMALEQIEDLIYNKWTTNEIARTDANGTVALKGFYGSYQISVIKNGVKKTVWVDCHKGDDNTVRIEMPF